MNERWNNDEFQWAQKYRPKSVDDCILPTVIKKWAKNIVRNGEIPNLTLAGPPGTGKTTLALAMAHDLNCDVLLLAGSGEDRVIDSVRTKVDRFARTSSFSKKKKVIIYDEGDNLVHDAQLALRTKIEQVSKNCSFIITANHPGRLSSAITSRCKLIEFKDPGPEENEMLTKSIIARAFDILNENDIKYDKLSVVKVAKKYMPDNRKILNTLQNSIIDGELSVELLNYEIASGAFKSCIEILKTKKWSDMNQYVEENITTNSIDLILYLARNVLDIFSKEDMSIPKAILILDKYQTVNSSVADPKLNIKACLTELITDCEFI